MRNMRIFYIVIAALWLILLAYWAVSAFGAKRTVRRSWSWWREIAVRIILVVLIILAVRLSALNRGPQGPRLLVVNNSLPLALLGDVLCALGVGLAIWARAHLGRNWGMPMTQKEEPDLVTSGPYARVRHPVYTGFLLAMLGSAVGESPIWLLPLLVFGVYFAYSARREESIMLAQFPRQYPQYRNRTRMFIPFIL